MAAGIDRLADLDDERLDLEHVVAIGHSAGGLLALWAAARPNLPAGTPGAEPRVRLGAVAALGAVSDLEADPQLTRPGQPVHDLMGGAPDQVPERYELANPRRRLPLGLPILLVHGDADEMIPVARTREFARGCSSGGRPGGGDRVSRRQPHGRGRHPHRRLGGDGRLAGRAGLGERRG